MPEQVQTLSHSPEAFTHVRIIVGIILGLCVSRLLNGLARFIQHPRKSAVYPAHLIWVMFMLISVARFWWFEFELRHLSVWTLLEYFFILFYSGLYFVLCSLLFPDSLEDYKGYKDYFLSRKGWFFSLLIALYAVDLLDSFLKGGQYFLQLGTGYLLQAACLVFVSIVGAISSSERTQTVISVCAVAIVLTFTFTHYVAIS